MRPDYRKAMLESEITKLVTQALREAKDPRLKDTLITISRCELSNDKKFADIYVSVMGDKEERMKTVENLNKIKGYFRTYLANNLDLYSAPQVRFKEDPGIEASVRIQQLLNKIKEEE
ncbi:MAG: 30S ribosome-binding factor RbfA [Pseudothermotoga sp.]